MVPWFIDFLKRILCCEHDTYNDRYLDRYHNHENSYIRIQDQRTLFGNFFSRRAESGSSSNSASSSIYRHEHTSSRSNATARVPAKEALVSPSTNHYQAVIPSSASTASSVSSNDKLKLFEPSQPRVVVQPPKASTKPPKESVSKLSYTTSPSISSKPPLFATSASSSASAASSISSNAKPKPYEPSQPRVVVLPPTASSKPPKESVSKPSYTPSPSISSKPPPSAISVSSSASAASSLSSNAKPKPSETSQPCVVVLPPTASSKAPKESVSKQSDTHSPSILSSEQASSPKPPPVASSGTSSASSTKPPPVASSKSKSSSIPSSSSFERHEGDLKSVKAVLHRVSSEANETTYAQEDTSPIYMIPKEIQDIIKRDEVPAILSRTLTPLTYKDYFATLLYAEDFEIEKWSEFELKDVSLQLHEASILKQTKDRNRDAKDVKDNRIFVTFKIDSVPERRPLFLSRDFVFAKPVSRQDRKFQGIINRVQKSTQVLVEFEDRFFAQHNSRSRYDISFSFNRVCLKRAHQALEAALHPSFKNFLFPSHSYKSNYSPRSPSSHSFDKLGLDQQSAMRRILGLKGSPPYLVMGPPIQYLKSSQPMISRNGPKKGKKTMSRTGVLVREAVLEIYRMVENCHILVSAPKNSTCDDLMSSLMKDIPELEMFRANAAFRDAVEVPDDIFTFCHYRKDCFTCPPLQKLKNFRVVFSTFVSGFRLHNKGIEVGHFSHIFLVDANLAIEPDVMITLANFANDDTSVIVTGSPFTSSRWVRSEIAWSNGLHKSYFQRLRENALYRPQNSEFITQLQDPEQKSH